MTVTTAFIQSVRQWLDENCPPAMRQLVPSAQRVSGGRKEPFLNPDAKHWFERMRDKGWLAPTWPVAYGGAGLSAEQARVIQRQMQALNCQPPLISLGIHMMGPTIMEFGTDEQKQRFLPPIARGEIRWCQGYSEPGAGSDLASLKCRAERQGDHYIVNGQKVWTSFADKSDFLFCLVRTDFSVPKHEGISVLLIDMETAGVSVKPIELISGSSHFCEVFLDNVIVPKENLLGALNKGWAIAKRMLQHERNMMGQRDLGEPFNPSPALMAARYIGIGHDGRIRDAVKRDAIAASDIQHHAIAATTGRVMAELKAGGHPAASSVLKYATTEAYKDKFELLLQIMGQRALGWAGNTGFDDDELRIAKEWAFSKVQSIGGGTSEIQLNIIAKQILQLPE